MNPDDDGTDDAKLVDRIVEQLGRGELVWSGPFGLVPGVDVKPGTDEKVPELTPEEVKLFVRAEVRRSVVRIRARPTWPKEPSAADARKAAKALEPFAYDPGKRDMARWFSRAAKYQQYPPPRANLKKWWCAEEAFYLVETVCKKPPTGHRDGSYVEIATILYEALTGEIAADLYDPCRKLLAQRHKFTR
jgi:hypothetical protein